MTEATVNILIARVSKTSLKAVAKAKLKAKPGLRPAIPFYLSAPAFSNC
jgi:hypothetical protein